MKTEIFKILQVCNSAKIKTKLRMKQKTASQTSNVWLAKIRIEGISDGGAGYPERITGGIISLTTGDSGRGCLGAIFRFLGLYVSVYSAGMR